MINKTKHTARSVIGSFLVWLKDRSKFNQHILAAMAAIAVAVVIVMSVTNPNIIGPVGILTTLILLYALFFLVILHFRNKGAGKFTTYTHKKQLVFRSALDATPFIILVGLNTIRQVTIEDLLIIPVLYLAFKFYAHKQLGL